MAYPIELVDLEHGMTLYIPVQNLLKPMYEELILEDKTAPFPFWAKIWPASKAMSAFLQSELLWVQNKHVVEIGAGMGTPSFLIAKHAREVIISDYVSEAVKLIDKNINYLGLQNAKALCLDWNQMDWGLFPTDMTNYTIVLSDINYAPDQFEPLLNLIQKFMNQGSTILLATPQRITAFAFVEAIQPYIKKSVLHTVMENDQVVEIRILVLYV